MSDRCEPPEHLRGVNGWHWLHRDDERLTVEWERNPHGGWCSNCTTPEDMAAAGSLAWSSASLASSMRGRMASE